MEKWHLPTHLNLYCNTMKKIIVFALAALLCSSAAASAPAAPASAPVEEKKEEAPKTKRVCIKRTDPNTKAEKEVCRTVKVHKKLEGTKVPEKK